MKRAIFFSLFFFLSLTLLSAKESAPVVEGVIPKRIDNPPDRDTVLKSIGRGVNFLMDCQNRNGSWGAAKNTKGLDITAPGSSHDAFRAGTTAICLWALLDLETASKRKENPIDLDEIGIDADRLQSSIEKAEWWTKDFVPKLRRSSDDVLYNVWGHAYSIHALVRMYERFPDDVSRQTWIIERIRGQVEMLRRFETIYGGWFYYDENKTAHPSESTSSFVSATGLIALKEAQRIGVDIPQKMIERTMKSMRRQRLPDFSYLYGEYLRVQPRAEINRPAGSLGRSQACNLAMRRWGDREITDEILIDWLNRLYARNGWLDVGRKRPVPHESFFGIAGYFFYYGHFYASLCIQEIPERERIVFNEFLADVLIGLQEKDGSWWDFPLYDYHQQYGTGFAVLSLLRTF